MMFGKLWNAVVRPSLTRRLVLAQIGLLLILWLGMVFLIIKDIAYTDRWYTPGLMRDRTAMILSVVEGLHDRPAELNEALTRIDIFQRSENREEDTHGLRVTMMVWKGAKLVYVTPGERRQVQVDRPGLIEHSMQDGRRFRTYLEISKRSDARVVLLLPADAGDVFIALWSRGFVLLPIVISLPVLILPAWLSVWLALRPFRKVATEIEAKGPDDLAPLANTPAHRELQSLGKAVDGLLARVRDGVDRERRFVADAAHELRTPLAAMRINVEALRQRAHSPENLPLIEGLMHSGDRAARLVSQLLSLMRSDATRESRNSEAVRLDQLAQERLAALGGIAHQREVELELDAAAAVTVEGERQGLITLIDNLVENAIKYSPAKGTVRVTVLEGAEGPALCIEDSGPGIPMELRGRVFERFYRAPDQVQSGSGLGLAIVKAVADSLGAAVTLDESSGGGLCVTVRFRARTSAQSTVKTFQ